MRIAVCEDESLFRKQLIHYLEHTIRSLSLKIEEFDSGEALLMEYEKGIRYDVLFLDIEMKKVNGIDTAKRIRSYHGEEYIIFLTSHIEYAMDGYEVDAYRFLQKPVQEEKLRRALRELWATKREANTFIVHTSEGEAFLKKNEIVYIESIRNDLYIHTIKQREYRTRKSMKETVRELESCGFFQCHRSYLINMDYLSSYDSKSVTLEYDIVLPMSRGKNRELREVFMKRFHE